jgi:putative Holliday junction resolvase
MRRGRILAIDYGTKNIGLACSDELGITVQPLPSLRFASRRDLVSRLRQTIREKEIREFVIGIPFNMNGSSGDSVRRVERFIEILQREFELPLRPVDERLSTLEAMEFWKEMSPRQQRKYRSVDSLSAALILERYLKEQ